MKRCMMLVVIWISLSYEISTIPVVNAEEHKNGPSNDLTLQSKFEQGVRYWREHKEQDAYECFQKAAEQGHAGAAFYLYLYYIGRDKEKSLEWLKRAAEQGDVAAQEAYAGKLDDIVIAFDWYRKAAVQGAINSQLAIATYYWKGLGNVAQNRAEAIKWFHKAAQRGSAVAQHDLAVCYWHGLGGLPKDRKKAQIWCKKALAQAYDSVDRGMFRDPNYLMIDPDTYFLADGSETDNPLGSTGELPYVCQYSSEIHKVKPKAQRQEDAKALFERGVCYLNGTGVVKDLNEAIGYFSKSAKQGYAKAQYMLGGLYLNGEAGVPKNVLQGIYWLQKAADQGFALAQSDLGICYINGNGVQKNTYKGKELLLKAAVQGNKDAQYNLGVCYMEGVGGQQNPKLGLEWMIKAAKQGHEKAQEFLRFLNKSQYGH